MALLVLDSIRCVDQQEKGSDEIYFVFKDNATGVTRKSNVIGNMDEEDGGSVFSLSDRFSFTHSVDVQLWEDDPVGDDFIDTAFIRAPSSSTFDSEVLSAQGVRYVLEWYVIA